MEHLTPRQIVKELDKYIVGQQNAKKCVAVALRNRYRRQRLGPSIQDEIMPKNIIMIGPTGVGKTEIARRLAKLVNAPFIKVEATKFTEVGYVGRDVESIIRDLVETSIHMIKNEKMEQVRSKGEKMAEARLLDLLAPMPTKSTGRNPMEMLFGGAMSNTEEQNKSTYEEITRKRAWIKERLARGEMEDEIVEIEIEEQPSFMFDFLGGTGMEEMGINLQDMLGGMLPKKKKKRKLPVSEARKILTQEEAQKLIDMDEVVRQGVYRAEQSGIIFWSGSKFRENSHGGPDVSGRVQRDILPIVGFYGYDQIRSGKRLYAIARAFILPNLRFDTGTQGRFPIRVSWIVYIGMILNAFY